jgi:hypothetical protein
MKSLLISLIMTPILALPIGGWPATTLQHKVIFENRRDHVFLTYESDESNKIVSQNYEHPVQLNTEKISKILGQLKYSKKVFFKWREKNYDVFFKSELDKLSEPISQALQNASPNEWVNFASSVESRDIDSIPLLTDGCVFKKEGKLHVVFLNLKFEFDDKNRPKSGDPREFYSLGFKRMNLADAISAPPVNPGVRFLDQPHDNWAVIDADALLNPKKETKAKTVEPTKIEKRNLVERMKILKELYDNDLITDQEYRKKKEELLDEL